MNLFQKLQLARNIYIKIIRCYHATRRHVLNLWERNHNDTFELISSQKIKKCGAVDVKIKWILSTALIIIYVSNFYAYLYGACEIYRIYNCLIKRNRITITQLMILSIYYCKLNRHRWITILIQLILILAWSNSQAVHMS